MSDYYILITDAGAALEAAAHAAGEKVELAEFGVCDGGVDFIPDPTATTFPNEVYHGAISSLKISETDPTVFVAQCIIPSTSGGYTVRGIALYSSDGTLYATGNYANQDKPAPDSGLAVSLEILAQLAVSDTSDITLVVTDTSYLTEAQADTLYLRQDKKLSEIAEQGAEAEKEARENIGVNLQPAPAQPDEGTIPLNGWDCLVNVLNMKTGTEGTELKVSAYVIVNPDQSIQEVRLKVDGGAYITGSLSVGKPMNVSGPADVPLYMLGNQCGFGQSELDVIDIYLGGDKVGTIGSDGVSIDGQLIPTDYGNYDERYQAKGSYTPAGEAYTKSESDGRYVQGVRMANYGTYGSGGIRDSSHTVLTGIYATNGWDNPTTQEARTPQFNINGSWYDMAYV